MRSPSVFLAAPEVPTAPESMQQLVAGQLSGACNWPDEQRDGLINALLERYGEGVRAILIYGSYLRGKRDTLLDFYVLLDRYAAMKSRWQSFLAWLLSPNVYQVRHGAPPAEARAKYALMTLGRFEHAMQHDFHSYFWARFTQPSGLVYCRDDASRERVVQAICDASSRFVKHVVPRLPEQFSSADLVSTGLSLTYRCELRSEPAGHAEALYGHNAAYYQDLVKGLAVDSKQFTATATADQFTNTTSKGQKRWAVFSWWLRRLQGKVLSVLRLLKATLTFSGGFDYLLWKISRHSNVQIEPTERQRRYPLIFGWPLLWRLYRCGAFR